jgi:hypothetical protein
VHRDTIEANALVQEIAAMRAELSALRSELATLRDAADPPHPSAAEADDAELHVTSRRRLFALAGGAAVAAAAVAVGGSVTPAAANNGSTIFLANNAVSDSTDVVCTFLNYTIPTTNTNSRNLFAVGDVSAAFTPAVPAAVSGYGGKTVGTGVSGITSKIGGNGVLGFVAAGTSGSSTYGVYGVSQSGAAVVGESTSGFDLYAKGTGRVYVRSFISAGPPTTGDFSQGEIVRDASPNLWMCTNGGAQSTWRRFATSDDVAATNAQVATVGQQVAALNGQVGTLTPLAAQVTTLSGRVDALTTQVGSTPHPASFVLVTPTRVYDSRLASQPPGNTGGRISAGTNRIVSVAGGIDIVTGAVTTPDLVPAGATGIVCNLTIAGADGGGYLALTPGDAMELTASTINWSPGTSDLANGTTVKLDAQRRVKIFAGGGGSVDLIIDVAGYYV